MADFMRKMAVNKQWNKQKPDDWHGSTHHKHREVLYDLLKLDESIEKMVAGHFGPDPEPQDKKMESPMMNPQTGIAVATQDRIIFVAKGIFSKATDEVLYSNIKAVSYRFAGTTGDAMLTAFVTADPATIFHGLGPMTGRCRIEEYGRRNMLLVNIRPRETVKPFVEYIRSRVRVLQPITETEQVAEEPALVENVTFEYDPLGDTGEQLKRLKSLWEQGHITDNEMLANFKEMDSRR